MWRHLWNQLVDGTLLVFAMDPSGLNRSQQYQGGLRFRLDGFAARDYSSIQIMWRHLLNQLVDGTWLVFALFIMKIIQKVHILLIYH